MWRLASIVLVCVLLAQPALLKSAGESFVPVPASGVTYVVNSGLDEPDADPSNGTCFSTPSGKCTLRAAIMEANVALGNNTITGPSGVYLLTRPYTVDSELVGYLDITAQLTIQGAGPGATTVDGNDVFTNDRVFQVLESAVIVTVTDLTIRNGSVPTSDVSRPSWGGGILADGQSGFLKLTLNDVVLEGNSALTGGGLYASNTKVDLENSTVRSNADDAGGVPAGGSMPPLAAAGPCTTAMCIATPLMGAAAWRSKES